MRPAGAGSPLVALIDVRVSGVGARAQFEAALADLEPVEATHQVAGRFGYHLRAACRDAAELHDLVGRIERAPGVAETETRLVLHSAGA